MHLRVTFGFYLLCLSAFLVDCSRERKIAEILDGVQRIEDLLKREERLREITDIVRIDSTVDKLNKKLDIVIDLLDNAPSGSPRSGAPPNSLMSRDVSDNLEGIEARLGSLEASVAKVEESTAKIGLYAARIEEIESRTTQMKDDTNTKLRKIMNVITALYEMNKDMKSNMGAAVRGEDALETPGANPGYASEFLIENLEEMERKIKEQFSVLSSELRSEITGLKIVASTLGANCQAPSDAGDDEDEWLTPSENGRSVSGKQRSRSVSSTLDNLVETLGRQTREIREDIQNGMQEIDIKLNNLTSLAARPSSCGDFEVSETIQSFKSVLPEQDVADDVVPDKSTRTESCTKSFRNVPNPKSCAELRKGGATCDGIYVIFPKSVRAVRVYCDMTTDGGGWTLLMRRGDYGDKMTSFHKNWASYKNGFGDSEGEFWLGNDVMHMMTEEDDQVLRVHLSAFDGSQVNLDYSAFGVANESSAYRLRIGYPTGPTARLPAANSLRYHNNHPFSTFDRKNDNFEQNCAATYKGGWWFNGCYFGFLTGEYFRADERRESWQGIMWYDWKGNQSLKGAEMMIRPKSFHNARSKV